MGRLASDIGGTFTDLVHFDEETGALSVAKSLSTPDDLTRGVLDTIDQAGLDARRCGLLRPLRDDGHQRHHRADRCEDRAGHHRGLPGRAGDRARQPPRSLQSALPQGGPLRAAPAALRGARAGRRQGPGPGAAPSRRPGPRDRGVQGRGGGGHRHPVPPLLRRTRARGGNRGLSAPAPRWCRGHRLSRDHARVARVRAREHGRAQRLRAADRAALLRHAGGRPRRPLPRLPDDGDAVERRHRELRLGQGAPDYAARIGPRRRASTALRSSGASATSPT